MAACVHFKNCLTQFCSLYLHSIIFHVIRVKGHEHDVDDGADGDEEISEGVEDEIGEDLGAPDPDAGAIPDAKKVATSLQTIHHNVFHFWPLVIFVLRVTF